MTDALAQPIAQRVAAMSRKASPTRRFRSGAAAHVCTVLALIAPLAACGPDRLATGSITPEALEERHPIVIAEAPYELDVFVAHEVDEDTTRRISAFAQTYARLGHGPITVLLPTGVPTDHSVHAALPKIKKALVEGGARGAVSIGSYPAQDPTLASPVHLSFIGVRAHVASQCGLWPNDVGSGSSIQGWENRPYWNMGCARQSMLAAQLDDPRDLAGPRGERAGDVSMRLRAIGKVREGSDPGTSWLVRNSSISSVGASQ